MKLKELEAKYEELEVKSKKDIEILTKENNCLKRKIKDLEAKNKKLTKTHTENGINVKCFNCNYETTDNVALKMHVFDKHVWQKGQEEAEDLDLSIGPRFCRKCDYQAEDGYDLDAHFWGEHDDTDNETINCKFCDEVFESLNDLMKHMKTNHRENIFGSEKCWFQHKKDEVDDNYDPVKNNNFENNEVIQKIFKMMETMTQRILDIENN